MNKNTAAKRVATTVIDVIAKHPNINREALAALLVPDMEVIQGETRLEVLEACKNAVDVVHMLEVDKVNRNEPVDARRNPRYLSVEASGAASAAIDRIYTGGK